MHKTESRGERRSMANTLGLSLCLVCVLLLPLWLQQIFADDAGLLAIGGGRLTHEHVFGGRREPGYPPILFHCLAYSGEPPSLACSLALSLTHSPSPSPSLRWPRA